MRTRALYAALEATRAPQPLSAEAQHELTRHPVYKHLEEAWDATCERGSRRLRSWWSGAAAERAWGHLHEAELSLVASQSIEALNSARPKVVSLAEETLPKDDARCRAIAARLAGKNGWTDAKQAEHRADYASALGWVYEALEAQYKQLRSFRNLLLVGTVGLFLVALGLAFIGLERPSWIPLCFEPQQASGTAVCPTGEAKVPAGAMQALPNDVMVLETLGFVGGALAAAVAIRGMRGTATPYGVPVALAVLKLPFGALTALTGVLLLRAGFVPGFSALDSQSQIIGYALVFGYAQQVATRLIDRQGQSVLDRLPNTAEQGADQPARRDGAPAPP